MVDVWIITESERGSLCDGLPRGRLSIAEKLPDFAFDCSPQRQYVGPPARYA